MKHFKKSAMMTALCLGLGITAYNASADEIEGMVYNPNYIRDLDEVDMPASNFEEPYPALPEGTTVLLADDGGDVGKIDGLCEFKWHGNEMVGMKVTFVVDGPVGDNKEIGQWVTNPPGNFDPPPTSTSGGVIVYFDAEEENGWMLTHPQDTFKDAWRLEAIGNPPDLIAVKIEGLADMDNDRQGSVFDVYYAPMMTPGSKRGRPFEWIARPFDVEAPTGEYSQEIRIIGDANSPYHDLFGTLTVNFPDPWDGSGGTVDFAAFIADTDCADLAVPVVDLEAMPIRSGIHLKWAPGPVDPSSGYVVYRQQEGDELELLEVVSNPMFKDKDVESGAVYTYSVVALEKSDDSRDPSLSAQAAEVTVTAK